MGEISEMVQFQKTSTYLRQTALSSDSTALQLFDARYVTNPTSLHFLPGKWGEASRLAVRSGPPRRLQARASYVAGARPDRGP